MTAAREGSPRIVRREDYAPPAYWIDTVDLTFDLDPFIEASLKQGV